MSEKLAIRGISSQFNDPEYIVSVEASCPQPEAGGCVFVLSYGWLEVGMGYNYNPDSGGCFVNEQTYESIEELENEDMYVIEEVRFAKYLDYISGELVNSVAVALVLSANDAGYKFYHTSEQSMYDDEEDLFLSTSLIFAVGGMEVTRVYYISDGDPGWMATEPESNGPTYVISARHAGYYETTDDAMADWTTEGPEELSVTTSVGRAYTIPEGYHIYDVRTSVAYMTKEINIQSQTSNVWNNVGIGEYGMFGLDHGFTANDFHFGAQPVLQMFKIVTVGTSNSGNYFTYRSSQTLSSARGQSADSPQFDYISEDKSQSAFIWCDKMTWTSPYTPKSDYAWQLRYYNSANQQVQFAFSMPRDCWSVSGDVLTWNIASSDPTDQSYYYNGLQAQILMSKTPMSEVKEAYARSSANQGLNNTLMTGRKTSVYGKRETITQYTTATQFKLLKILSATGAEVDKTGITLINESGALKIQNTRSTTNLVWARFLYREILE